MAAWAQSPPEGSPPAAALEARSENGSSLLLPLVSETLRVRIDDGHASASYTHVFQNESAARLEGNYRLQVGEGATATAFAYYNGEAKIVGEIFEREAAQEVYDALTGLKRDPGLLEQSGEGGFSFHVFPIDPGEKKRIEVTTSRWLARRAGRVEYRARLSRSDAGVTLVVKDGRGIKAFDSPSHDIAAVKASDGSWDVRVLARKSAEAEELVIRYEIDEAPLTLHATLHHDAGEAAFFTATLATPSQALDKVRPSQDVTLVLDRSGSMEGPSIESARSAATAIVTRLGPNDRVNVVAFDNDVSSLYDSPHPLTESTRQEALGYIRLIQAGGGTDIAKALAKALQSQIAGDQPNVVLFLTDGQSAGPPAIQVASEDKGHARVFTVGIGTGVDKALLSRIASIKHGRFTFIADPTSVAVEFPKVLSQLEEPVLTDVTLHAEGGSIERVYPQALANLFPDDELRVFGRASAAGPFKIVLEGREGGAARRFETTIDPSASSGAPWVARGWARARVDELLEQVAAEGETDELKNEAIDLGLAYELVTPYTSFLAVPESAMTEAAKTAIGSVRERRRRILAARTDAASLSRMNMPPGDPILRVQAPRDAKSVTATFPFGLTQDLAYDDMSETWMTRFLVPKDVSDGAYEVRVVVVLRDGKVNVATVRYTIDSRAPQVAVDAKAAGDGVDVRVLCDEPALEARAATIESPTQWSSMNGSSDRLTFTGHMRLSPGVHRLRVVVSDIARNETAKEIEVTVPERPAFVRTMVGFRGRLWVGTFNDGFYVVDAPSGVVDAQDSQAPRHVVATPFRMVNDAVEARGSLYVAANEGLFVTSDGARFRRVSRVGARGVTGVSFDGKALYATTTAALWRLGVSPSGPPDAAWWKPAGSRSLQGVVASSGGVWLASEDRGVIRFDGKTFVAYDRLSGLPASWVVSIAEDGHGGVFAGTLRDGALHVDREGRWHKLGGLPSEWTLTVARADGHLCVGTQDGAACYDERTAAESAGALPTERLSALPDARVHSFLAAKGRLLVGTQAGMAVVAVTPPS